MKGYGIQAMIALAVHITMFVNGFVVSLPFLGFVIATYLGLWIFYWIMCGENGDSPRTGLIIILMTVGMYLLAWGADTYLDGIARTLTIFIVTISPVWFLYMLLKIRQINPDGYAAAIFTAYKLIVAIIVVTLFLSQAYELSSMLPEKTFGNVDARANVGEFFDDFMDKFDGTWKKGTTLLNQSLNPSAYYYTGEVEQNTKKELGVRIENVRLIAKEVDNTTPIEVYADVYANTFIRDYASVIVQPACIMPRKGAPNSTVDPALLDVVFGTSNQYRCTFPPMTRGTYQIKTQATFPFQTWAYITYTFVDDERARNLAKQGLDIRKELDIDADARAIYTAGPVMLGMGGTQQPIRVVTTGTGATDPEKGDTFMPEGTRVGVTVDTAWAKGVVDHVERIELKVPEPFYLFACDRNITHVEPDSYAEGYFSYTFDNAGGGVVNTFLSLTCRLGISDQESARILVADADKVERSIVAVAHYTYTIEEQTSVRVR